MGGVDGRLDTTMEIGPSQEGRCDSLVIEDDSPDLIADQESLVAFSSKRQGTLTH